MATRSFSITVIRPRDLLLLRVQFIEVDLDQTVTPAVVSGRDGAVMVVHFQPQHIAEQAYWDTGKIIPNPPIPDETPLPPGGSASFIAGATRLVFRVPSGTSFPLTLEALLDAARGSTSNRSGCRRRDGVSSSGGTSPPWDAITTCASSRRATADAGLRQQDGGAAFRRDRHRV